MPTYLERYQSGEQVQVWAELTALGEQVRQEDILPDALAVVRETMSRVRENVMRIISRLQSIKYDFDNSTLMSVGQQSPTENIKDQIAKLEAQAGLLPLSLRAWYEVGGAVDLTGFNAHWPSIYTDPLVILPIEEALSEFADWQQHIADAGPEEVGPFLIPVAPDFYFKANFAGGGPYQNEMPNAAADALVLYEWHNASFVEYLRECFRWGGFPGFDVSHPMNPNHLNANAVMPQEHLALLTKDLLPI